MHHKLIYFYLLILFACSNGKNFSTAPSNQVFGDLYQYNNKVDLLIIVDNTLSMEPFQNKLRNEVPSILQTLDSVKMDYQIASISSCTLADPKYCNSFIGKPSILTNQTPNVVSLLQDRVAIGDTGGSSEFPLLNFMNIFSNPANEKIVKSFLRPDAYLVILVLSDSDDVSSVQLDDSSKNNFLKFINTLKPPFRDGGQSWYYNLIGKLSSRDNCSLSPFNGTTKHMRLVQLSGGVMASICDASLAYGVSNIKSRLLEIITELKLNKIPKIETLRVFVSDHEAKQDASNGWTYNPAKNAVVFHGDGIPSASDTVRISFDPAEAN